MRAKAVHILHCPFRYCFVCATVALRLAVKHDTLFSFTEMHDQQLLRRGLLERVALQLQPVASALHFHPPWGLQAWKTVERFRGVRFRGLLARRGTQAVHVGDVERSVPRARDVGQGLVSTQHRAQELSSQPASQQVRPCCAAELLSFAARTLGRVTESDSA